MQETPSAFEKKPNEKQRGTSILFVNSAGHVLLFLRDNNPIIPFPNCWDVLGGHVEEGETPFECITREIQEEINMKLENAQLFHVYDLEDRLEFTFWQAADLNIDQIMLNEGQCLKWFTEKEIIDIPDHELAFGFKPIIISFLKTRSSSSA
jgi:8-oxo-dGTP diphosphatase